jgi:hypothetical protein
MKLEEWAEKALDGFRNQGSFYLREIVFPFSPIIEPRASANLPFSA